MIRFLIELLARRTWFGQFDELYFVLNWLVMYEMQFIVQELYESRGRRPGLSVLMSLLISVDVKIY